MHISRRNLLSGLAASAVASAAFRAANDVVFARSLPIETAKSAAEPIFLSRNENAYGPSQKVLAAMQEALTGSNRYPRTEYDSLVKRLAGLHQVRPEQIVLGCGSSEILC